MLNVEPYLDLTSLINLILLLLGVAFDRLPAGGFFGAMLVLNVIISGALYVILGLL